MKNAKQKQKKEMQNIENAKIKTAMLGAYTTKSKKTTLSLGAQVLPSQQGYCNSPSPPTHMGNL